jgi:hypothetical protein
MQQVADRYATTRANQRYSDIAGVGRAFAQKQPGKVEQLVAECG